jgi:putative ABC transport system permease protein
MAVTKGIRAFTTTPYVLHVPGSGRAYVTSLPANDIFSVEILPTNTDVESVRNRLRAILTSPKSSHPACLLPQQFLLAVRHRRRRCLFAGAPAGLIVGTVIVAQTLYSSTRIT